MTIVSHVTICVSHHLIWFMAKSTLCRSLQFFGTLYFLNRNIYRLFLWHRNLGPCCLFNRPNNQWYANNQSLPIYLVSNYYPSVFVLDCIDGPLTLTTQKFQALKLETVSSLKSEMFSKSPVIFGSPCPEWGRVESKECDDCHGYEKRP